MTALRALRGPGRVAALALAAVLLAWARPVDGQQTGPGGLAAAEAAADSGQVERARRLLRTWREERAEAADPGRRGRADFLAARLATDADSARRLYARLAVEAGGELAARARLRLAQLHLAGGRPGPALRQLELVRSDLPGSSLTEESWLWTGRARLASGDTAAGCVALRRAAEAGGGLRERAARAGPGCGPAVTGGGLAAAGEAPPGPGDESDDPAPRAYGERTGEAASDAWTVQLGAFRDPAAAGALAERAREAGWEARELPAGEDGLRRVRVGRWRDRPAAEQAARSLEEDGFRVLVVEARPADADR